VLIAVGFFLSIVWLVRRLDQPLRVSEEPGDRRVERWTNRAIVLLSLAFLACAVWRGVNQDYYLFRQMWKEVRLGHDPWWLTFGVFGHQPLNAYGPLFNGFAILDWINPLAPKLFFAWAYLVFASWMIKIAGRQRQRSVLQAILLLAWFWNPYVWVENANYGHFDVLVGIACVVATGARIERRDVMSGVVLGLGVLLKYMPIVLLPFLVLDGGRIRPRFRLFVTACAVILLGLAISEAVWGPSVFRPLLFAAQRDSQYLSIFRYLKGLYSPLIHLEIQRDFDAMSAPILFVALLRAWTWSRLRSVDTASSAVLAIVTTLLFYKVGFPQYQMVLFVLASYWVAAKSQQIRNRVPLYVALGCYFGWLSIFDVIECTKGVDFHSMQEWAGLPTFLLGCGLIVCIVRASTTQPTQDRSSA
jgi:Glycosyltransferase family 87